MTKEHAGPWGRELGCAVQRVAVREAPVMGMQRGRPPDRSRVAFTADTSRKEAGQRNPWHWFFSHSLKSWPSSNPNRKAVRKEARGCVV